MDPAGSSTDSGDSMPSTIFQEIVIDSEEMNENGAFPDLEKVTTNNWPEKKNYKFIKEVVNKNNEENLNINEKCTASVAAAATTSSNLLSTLSSIPSSSSSSSINRSRRLSPVSGLVPVSNNNSNSDSSTSSSNNNNNNNNSNINSNSNQRPIEILSIKKTTKDGCSGAATSAVAGILSVSSTVASVTSVANNTSLIQKLKSLPTITIIEKHSTSTVANGNDEVPLTSNNSNTITNSDNNNDNINVILSDSNNSSSSQKIAATAQNSLVANNNNSKSSSSSSGRLVTTIKNPLKLKMDNKNTTTSNSELLLMNSEDESIIKLNSSSEDNNNSSLETAGGASATGNEETTKIMKARRELTQLQKTAKASKILTEYMNEATRTKARKSKQIPLKDDVDYCPVFVKRRQRSQSFSKSRLSLESPISFEIESPSSSSMTTKISKWPSEERLNKRQNMRSQNLEFFQKHMKFLTKVQQETGDLSPDISDGESSVFDSKSSIAESHVDAIKKNWQPPIKAEADSFCWKCHNCGELISCSQCIRSFHVKCLKRQAPNNEKTWKCSECVALNSSSSSRNKHEKNNLTSEYLNQLLEFTIRRVKHVREYELFEDPVDDEDYKKYVVNPISLSTLENRIQNKKYKTTDEFLADVKWVLHNALLYHGPNGKISNAGKIINKICRQEIMEIEACSECYLKANTKPDWFIEVCSKPHMLLWAKLKSFPYWPAKAISTNGSMVNVRFFGDYDRAYVPIKDCYLYSEKNPNPPKQSKRNNFADCIKEVEKHIKKIIDKFGIFTYAPYHTVYDPSKEIEQLEMLIPGIGKCLRQIESPPPKPALTLKIVKTDNQLSVVQNSDSSKSDLHTTKNQHYRIVSDRDTSSSSSSYKDQKKQNDAKDEEKIEKESKIRESGKNTEESRRYEENNLKRKDSGVIDRKSKEKEDYGDDDDSESLIVCSVTVKRKSNDAVSSSNAIKSSNEPRKKSRISTEDHHNLSAGSKSSETEPTFESVINYSNCNKITIKRKLSSDERPPVRDAKSKLKDNEAANSQKKLSPVSQKRSSNDLKDSQEEQTSGERRDGKEEEAQSSENALSYGGEIEKSQVNEKETSPKNAKRKRSSEENSVEESPLPSIKESNRINNEETIRRQNSQSTNATTMQCVNYVRSRFDKHVPFIEIKAEKPDDYEDVQENCIGATTGIILDETPLSSRANSHDQISGDAGKITIKEEIISDDELEEIGANKNGTRNVSDIINRNSNCSTSGRSIPTTSHSTKSKEVILIEGRTRQDQKARKSFPNKVSYTMILPKPNVTIPSNSGVASIHRQSNPLVQSRSNGNSMVYIPINNKENQSSVAPQPQKSSPITTVSVNSSKELPPNTSDSSISTAPIALISTSSISTTESITNLTEETSGTLSYNHVTPDSKEESSTATTSSNCTPVNPLSKTIPTTCIVAPITSVLPQIPTTTLNSQIILPIVLQSAFGVPTVLPATEINSISLQQTTEVNQIAKSQITTASSFSRTLPTSVTSTILSTSEQAANSSNKSNSVSPETISTKVTSASSANDVESNSSSDAGEPMNESEPHMLSGIITPNFASAVTDILVRRPPTLIPKPGGPLKSDGSTLFPSSAGPVSQLLMKNAHKMADFFRSVIEDTLADMANMDNLEAKYKLLENDAEKMKFAFEKEMAELKYNTDRILTEMQKSFEKEKQRIISETRRQCEIEKEEAVTAAKRKQWCAQCGREAHFYCCWNTSYCSFPCQQKHWSRHIHACSQTNDNLDANAKKVGVRIRPPLGQKEKPPKMRGGELLNPKLPNAGGNGSSLGHSKSLSNSSAGLSNSNNLNNMSRKAVTTSRMPAIPLPIPTNPPPRYSLVTRDGAWEIIPGPPPPPPSTPRPQLQPPSIFQQQQSQSQSQSQQPQILPQFRNMFPVPNPTGPTIGEKIKPAATMTAMQQLTQQGQQQKQQKH